MTIMKNEPKNKVKIKYTNQIMALGLPHYLLYKVGKHLGDPKITVKHN